MSEIDEIVGEFLVESYENLDRYDEDLLALERAPSDGEVLGSIFRTIHTIKGTCGFFGFERLESVSHVAENLLGKLRDGELVVTNEIASALLATGDALRGMLGDIEATGQEGEADHAELVATLERLHAGESAVVAPPAAAPLADVTPVGTGTTADPVGDTEPPKRLGDLLVEQGVASADDVALALHAQELGDSRPLGEILMEQAKVPVGEVDQTLASQASARGLADSSIRVDVGLLDELMNLVGELVLARNQIVQLVTEDQDSSFASASQRLNLITTELQEGVMKTRMQPIGNVWNKLPRVVRDLSLSVGKQVDLVMEGQDTELDKTIIEAIKDPLTHLVRNAVDHGIETSEQRVAAGKSATGHLVLRAYHEGGQVNIEIADDGAGIDATKLKAKALEKGLISAQQAGAMSEREALQLIFGAGFSTAAKVTNVSGRGVGMDVVRTNIERIGGTVDVNTELGQGTTFKVKIPLTLAIIPALVVSSQGDRYAIPQLNLLELVRLEGEQARTGIELLHGAPVYRLRGRLLPIVRLDDELGHTRRDDARDVINIVVLQADGHQFGLVVDDITDTQEIVVKPLGGHLKDATLFAGATIMGDGRIALILDVLGIAQRARVVSEARERSASLTDRDEAVAANDARRTLLLVGVADRRAAVALSEVSRLETFDPATVEWASGKEVVQYRDEILPLVRLGDAIGVYGGGNGEGPLEVVVHEVAGRAVGIVVDAILDIVEQELHLDQGDGRPGLLGSAVIQERVTDVLDVAAIVATVDPARFASDTFLGA
ncbi:chemotaxis protein CheA [Egicoccus halophilus]|uniref:histidine kinase n=1 Tax=Egicoccus halophilus TaxID=1670830 RepID=A0A8J3AC15_9ACTN|nr:chemotaxis protein CheA [Egicoccus halophilus]GGI08116.1 ATPase [Egicoccus halophilus]